MLFVIKSQVLLHTYYATSHAGYSVHFLFDAIYKYGNYMSKQRSGNSLS